MKTFPKIAALTLILLLAVVSICNWPNSKESKESEVGSFAWFQKNSNFNSKEGCLLALMGDPKRDLLPPSSVEFRSKGLISLVQNWPRDPDTRSALLRILRDDDRGRYRADDKRRIPIRKLTIQPLLDGWPLDEDVWESVISASMEWEEYDSLTNDFSDSAWQAFLKAKISDSYRKSALLRILRDGPKRRAFGKEDSSRSELASTQLLERWPGDIEVRDGLTAILASDSHNRLEAAKALCKAWHDYPVTKQLLCNLIGGNAKQSLAKDGDDKLRGELLDLLIAGWHDEEVKTVLIRATVGVVAQNIPRDDDLSVRLQSVKSLAKWRGDPSVTGVLMQAVDLSTDTDEVYKPHQVAYKLFERSSGYEECETMEALVLQSNANIEARDFLCHRALYSTDDVLTFNLDAVVALSNGWKCDAIARDVVIKVLELKMKTHNWFSSISLLRDELQNIAKSWAGDITVRDVFLKMYASLRLGSVDSGYDVLASEPLAQSLALGWSGDAAVKQALINALIGDATRNLARFQSEYMRCDAAVILGQSWAGDRVVMSVLMLAAHGDSSREAIPDTSGRVRRAATEALGQGWADFQFPEVISFLKKAAFEISSNESEVEELVALRNSAIEALSKIWPHDPETKNKLMNLALGNVAKTPMSSREAAIVALGKGWQGDYDVKQTLLRLAAQSSEDSDFHYEYITIRKAVLASFGPNWNDDADVKQVKEKK